MLKSRVVVIAPDYYPDNNAGAVRVQSFVQKLLDMNISVIVMTHNKAAPISNEKIIKSFCSKPSNEDNLILRLTKEWLFSLGIFLKVMLLKKNNIDFAIVSPPPFGLFVMASFACKIKGVKFILDVRDIYPDVYVSSGLIKLNSCTHKILSRIERYMYNQASYITTVSNMLRDRIASRLPYYNLSKVILIRNGHTFNYSDAKLALQFTSSSHDTFKVVMHGNFGFYQDIDLINKLCREVYSLVGSKIDFYFYGFGSKYSTIDNSLPNIHLMGSIPQADILKTLQVFNLGISIRTDDMISKESFPVKVYEYIGLGIPSVITPKGECSDFLESSNSGLGFNNFQVNEMASFIVKLSQDKCLYHDMLKSTQAVSVECSRDVQSNKIYELIKSFSSQ